MFKCQICAKQSGMGVKPITVVTKRKRLGCRTGRAGLDIQKEIKVCSRKGCVKSAEKFTKPLDYEEYKQWKMQELEKRNYSRTYDRW